MRSADARKVLASLRGLSRPQKVAIQIAFDFTVGLCVGLLLGAVLVDTELNVSTWVAICAASTLTAILFIAAFGTYTEVVCFMGTSSGTAIGISLFAGTVCWIALGSFFGSVTSPAGLLYWAGNFTLIYGARMVLSELYRRFRLDGERTAPVAIYGAGDAGRQLVASLHSSSAFRPVAFIDDDEALRGRKIRGLPVYARDDIAALIARRDIREVFVALPSASRDRRGEILNALSRFGVRVRSVPGLKELLMGQAAIEELRTVQPEDVLGREPIAPSPRLLNLNILEKSVLVTGAGGSIGSELCRQIAVLKPRELILLDVSEHALYQIEHELRTLSEAEGLGELPIRPVLGSITNRGLIRSLMEEHAIDTIFHAAAYKHVPMIEANTVEGTLNNVMGTKILLEEAQLHSVSAFVLVSTDKAVRPTSVMGASKRITEMLVQAAAMTNAKCKMSIVRFGNVLGSSGSVLPLFCRQIAAGGPVTVTHAEMTRYFMTIQEAAQLILQVGGLGRSGDVFHLDMGSPVKIIDLARRLIALHGLREKLPGADGDIEIAIVGMRPGEKLYEELLIGNNVHPTLHPRIFRADERSLAASELRALTAALMDACERRDEMAVREVLHEGVENAPAIAISLARAPKTTIPDSFVPTAANG
ncbi:MAG: NAD-dependent epimerase/dehydratase family protein [Alphaproteobacteria bacterium]|nr:NAD-dependent epimerase/dehydratase family protein [Alphaproteobacteria bacterium]